MVLRQYPCRRHGTILSQIAKAQEPASHPQSLDCSASMVESEKAALLPAIEGMNIMQKCSYFYQLWFADCLPFSCFCLLTDDGVVSASLSPPRKKSQIAKAQEPASHPQPHGCSSSIVESTETADDSTRQAFPPGAILLNILLC